MSGKHYNKVKKHNSLALAVIIICLILPPCFNTLARYVAEQRESSLVETRQFIFNCNYSNGGIYNIYGNNLIITLSNYELDYINQSDIEYTVSIKNQDGNNISYIDSGNGKIIGKTKNTSEINVTVDDNDNKTYMVEINTTKPYSTTLKMQFNVVEELPTENYYSITKNDSWIQLDVYIGSNVPSEGVTIDYTGLSPDNTNELMRNWISTEGVDTGVITNLNPYSKYSFIFFGECNAMSKTRIEENFINL